METFTKSVKMLGAGALSGILIDRVISPVLDNAAGGISNPSAQRAAKIGLSVIDLGLFGVSYSKAADYMGDFIGGVGVVSFFTGLILTTPKSQIRFRTALMETENYISGMFYSSGSSGVPVMGEGSPSSNPGDVRYNPAQQGNAPSNIVKPVDKGGAGVPQMATSPSKVLKAGRPTI